MRVQTTSVGSVLLATLMMVMMVMMGCASSSPQNTEAAPEKRSSGIEQPDAKNDGKSDDAKDGGKAIADCSTTSAGAELRDLKIRRNDVNTSLCDSLLATNKKVMVLYITSPTCVSCKVTLTEVEAKLANDDDVDFVVAVPTSLDEYVESYSAAEIASFVQGLAPSAKPAIDPFGKAWLALSEDASLPLFPLVLTFDRRGKGYVLNSDKVDSVSLIKANLLPKIDELK